MKRTLRSCQPRTWARSGPASGCIQRVSWAGCQASRSAAAPAPETGPAPGPAAHPPHPARRHCISCMAFFSSALYPVLCRSPLKVSMSPSGHVQHSCQA